VRGGRGDFRRKSRLHSLVRSSSLASWQVEGGATCGPWWRVEAHKLAPSMSVDGSCKFTQYTHKRSDSTHTCTCCTPPCAHPTRCYVAASAHLLGACKIFPPPSPPSLSLAPSAAPILLCGQRLVVTPLARGLVYLALVGGYHSLVPVPTLTLPRRVPLPTHALPTQPPSASLVLLLPRLPPTPSPGTENHVRHAWAHSGDAT